MTIGIKSNEEPKKFDEQPKVVNGKQKMISGKPRKSNILANEEMFGKKVKKYYDQSNKFNKDILFVFLFNI